MSLIQGLSTDGSNTMVDIRVDPATGGIMSSSTPTPSFTTPTAPAEIITAWNNFDKVNTANGDFVTYTKGLNGQDILALVSSPLTTGESAIELNAEVPRPSTFDFAMSYLRGSQIFATASLYANDEVTGLPDPIPDPINIISISQSSADFGSAYNGAAGTVVRIELKNPLPPTVAVNGVYVGDWFHISGMVDSRLNLMNALIRSISPDRKVISCALNDEVANLSLLIAPIVPPLGSAKVYFYNNMGGARDGMGMRMTQGTSTSNAFVTVRSGDDNQISGTLLGDHRVTTASTGIDYRLGGSANFGSYELRALSRFRFSFEHTKVIFSDKVEQSVSVYSPRDIRESVRPSTSSLKPQFRIYKPISMSIPKVEIVSAVKATASSTATITTRNPHGLVTGNYVTLKGSRDATNFGPLTTPVVVTVTGANTFTAVWGTAVIATSYGGSVVCANANKDMAGQFFAPQTIQSYSIDANGWVSITGTSTWGQALTGDYVTIHGAGNSTNGNATEIEGVWQVSHLSSTTMVLTPVYDINVTRISPIVALNVATTNCGGTVFINPTLRLHDYAITPKNSEIRIDGQGEIDATKALPIYCMGGGFSAVQGTAAGISGTDGSGGWYVRSGIIGITDIASAAISTSNTSAAIVNTQGNGFQVTFTVNPVSGTSPTMDVRIEESYDGGTSWFTLYDFQRITAIGNYNSPVLRASGRHIRYVRTIGGTTPSFTMSLVRTLLPFMPSEPHKRLIDRTIVLTTANSVTPSIFAGAANNAQLSVTIGAATTAPSLQLEGSENNLNWYSIGTPLATIANSTVEASGQMSATFLRARVSTAGVGVTPGFVCIKAYS